jgi:predicted deacylase
MEAKLQRMVSRNSAKATLVRYGQTVNGLNLNMVRIARTDVNVSSRPAIEISGVIHGNEYLGIEDRLAEHFLDDTASMPGLSAFLAKGGIVYFIPIVNPDGYVRKRRLNANSADLNRDFDLIPRSDMRFTQPETVALARYLEQDLAANQASLKLSLDYHCCVPALITPWSYIDAQPETKDVATFHDIGETNRNTLGYDYGNAMQTVNYLAEGSSIDYFYAKYGTLALAIEGNWFGEEQYFANHVAFWDKMFQKIADR